MLYPLVLLLLAGSAGAAAPPRSAALVSPGLYPLRADAAGLELEWIAPPVQTHPAADGTLEIEATGYPHTQYPGAPCLPFTSTLIAIPADASPTLRVLSAEETKEPLFAPLAVAPKPDGIARNEGGYPIGGTFADAAPILDTPPTAPVTLERAGIVRGVHLARLTFYPAIPQGTTLRVTHRLRLEVTWESQARLPPLAG